ncbi:MAG: DNA polymerase IV [ANME-2 cluster archaeon]|jgi:DNA polymerase IV (DinB-like DNA polymerase)|nr:DNA polymerase IV [ANME-2 cluster archaeon]
MERIILHVDMDSFYASVEQRENPSYKGKPVVVGSDPKGGHGRGVVSTCSYEARKFGIHSGMPISRAYKLCPDAVFLPVSMVLYKEVSRSIMEILHSFADKFQQVSVDEAYLDISEGASLQEAVEIAGIIKAQVMEWEGLTCSIGIASNRTAAKIASDLDKPDGLIIVEPGRVAEFLEPLEVRRLPGIGSKNEEILTSMDIRTIGQLARCEQDLLVNIFGKWGTRMHQLAHGIDNSEVAEMTESKSISKEHTFQVDTSDAEELYISLDGIAERVHRALMQQGFSFRTIGVKVRQEDFTTFSRARTLDIYTRDLDIIKRESRKLSREFFDGRKIRLLGIKLSNLSKSRIIQTTLDRF